MHNLPAKQAHLRDSNPPPSPARLPLVGAVTADTYRWCGGGIEEFQSTLGVDLVAFFCVAVVFVPVRGVESARTNAHPPPQPELRCAFFVSVRPARHVGRRALFLRAHVWPRGLISSHPALARRGRENVAPTLRDQFLAALVLRRGAAVC